MNETNQCRSSLCGADCTTCNFKDDCKGCHNTCGRPFGGDCVAAEYIRIGGRDHYITFKEKLKQEINLLLTSLELPNTDTLYELPGEFVNLTYILPNGSTAKFLNDKDIYLGAQIEVDGCGICYGVVANTKFILLCSYSINGSEPELILYQKR